MASKIKIYKGTVTAGGTDGTLVSSGTGLNPIESGAIKVPAAGYQEGSWIKLAVRCDAGYETVEDSSRHARISIVDTEEEGNEDKWQLSKTAAVQTGVDWGDSLGFDSKIGDKNVLFYARARVAHTEEPINDRTVMLKASATIGAAD